MNKIGIAESNFAAQYLFIYFVAVCNLSVVQIVVLSDVFNDKSQFDWMLTMLLDIQKSHPSEDELVMQYLIIGICKAAAVVGVVSFA